MTIKEKEKAGLSKFTPATVVKPIEKLDDNGKVLDRYASVSVAAKENNVSVSALSIAIRRGTKCKKMTFRFAKKPEPEENA